MLALEVFGLDPSLVAENSPENHLLSEKTILFQSLHKETVRGKSDTHSPDFLSPPMDQGRGLGAIGGGAFTLQAVTWICIRTIEKFQICDL